MDQSMTTTAFELPGYRVVHNVGVVAAQVHGKYTDALPYLQQYAQERGANAIIGVRLSTGGGDLSVLETTTLAYGTGVVVEPA